MHAGPVTLAVLLLATAGCTHPLQPAPAFLHEHSAFRMFLGSTEIAFNAPDFDLASTRVTRTHLHVSEAVDYVIHVEGTGRGALGEFFDSLGLEMRADGFRLDPENHQRDLVLNNATHAWRLWVDGCAAPEAWRNEAAFQAYTPRMHDRMLLAYAPRGVTTDQLRTQLDVVPTEAELREAGRDECAG